jgi:hypothetical protein
VLGGPELVRAPSRYRHIWSAPNAELSVWEAIPPDGFVAPGCVTHHRRNDPPPLDAIYCVHKNLVRRGAVSGEPLWTDRDFSAWKILTCAPSECELQLAPGTFVGMSTCSRPEGHPCAYTLRLKLCESRG